MGVGSGAGPLANAFYAMRAVAPSPSASGATFIELTAAAAPVASTASFGMLSPRKRAAGGRMPESNIQSVLLEERSFAPPAPFAAHARVTGAELEALHAQAEKDPTGFWADLARRELQWQTPFSVTLDDSRAPNYSWFTDG